MKPILFLLLISATFLKASATDNEDYSVYHTSVTKAEELASKKEFKRALDVYAQVFDKYDFVFLRDCKVATQIALHLGEEKKALEYLKLGVANGWELHSIKKNKLLKPLRQKEGWQEVKQAYSSIRENYLRRIDPALREETHLMFKTDQRLAIGALFRIGQKAQDRYAEQKFAPNSRQQLMQLDEILKEHGYPGEKLIGNSYWMEIILSHSNSISQEHAQNDTIYAYLRPKLMLALKHGEISPYELALIENWKTSIESGWEVKSYGYLSATLTAVELANADLLRSQIGLRSIEVRNRLIDVQEETGIDFYLPRRPKPDGKITLTNPIQP